MDKAELLGTVEGADLLIKELFLDLRAKVNEWSMVTCQTPQARMGYVGQHLTSKVTGYPGGKSGARGYDIVLPQGYGEIKTCYRVDQLGACRDCGAVVSAMEKECSGCGSTNIQRKDDSKWLIGLRTDKEFIEAIEPVIYYFVLFEFADLNDPSDIIASIWSVDSQDPGFALCMADYYLNIRANSRSKAPFNLWPYKPKFYLMKPRLIYRSVIHDDNTIDTQVFPGSGERDESFDFSLVGRSQNITAAALYDCIRKLDNTGERIPQADSMTKNELCDLLESICEEQFVDNATLCDALAHSVYDPLLNDKRSSLTRDYLEILDER